MRKIGTRWYSVPLTCLDKAVRPHFVEDVADDNQLRSYLRETSHRVVPRCGAGDLSILRQSRAQLPNHDGRRCDEHAGWFFHGG
jgi:hypothetical protein